MADQQSRGGKKHGDLESRGQREKHLSTHQGQEKNAGEQRPPAGQPGGPKPNAGQTRPQD